MLAAMTDEKDALPVSKLSRRSMLKVSLPVVAAAGLGVNLLGCGGASVPTTTVSAGALDRFPVGGAPTRLDEYDVFILRSDEGLAAVSGRCPHAGCGVEPAEAGFHCGCHGSEFTADGTVTQGPAQEDLTWFAVRLDAGEVIVDPSQVVPKGTYTAI